MSENKYSEERHLSRCESMCRLQSVISGKWKILIIWYISYYKMQRFNELFRRLEGITQSTLAKQLHELENDGFIHRKIYAEVPPRVEYTLTEMGMSFLPILNRMREWSEENLLKNETEDEG